MFSATDHLHMSHALRLAALGLNTTTPNPRVGCVIVRDGTVVGEGWHEKAGTPHAEVHALQQAGEAARGATAYVTLEPCSHHGRTPPCADALVRTGVARVAAAMVDPNPLVAGQGIARLRAAGIDAGAGLLEAEALELNKGFVSRMRRGRPWVTVKLGMSLDGKTALDSGQSQWITGPDARRDVQRLRARSCAVVTGSGTVRVDNPRLTVRDLPASRQPHRVVVDGALVTSPTAMLYRDGGTLIATTVADVARHAPFLASGNEIATLAGADGRVDLAALLARLAGQGVNEVMVEAGAGLAGAFLASGLVDEIVCYVAPCVVGHHARGLFDLPALADLADKVALRWHDVRQVGTDLCLTLRPVSPA